MARLPFIFFIFVFGLCKLVTSIVVDLPKGKVKGITTVTRENTTFHSFLALRFAKPPVGNLRFELPRPLEPWGDVYDATSEKNICFQTNMDSPKESEDCLFINVFTPKDLTSGNVSGDLAVMAFIHGGGFLQGSAYQNEGGVGPKFFMDYGVIMVAFQYRLGPFGFASTNDEIMPGNLGLKDQVFALKWIQENIKYFGGNAEKVTIFGQSAGGASVSYHLLSPQSKGLFAGAIQESGSALDPWAYQRNQRDITEETVSLILTNSSLYKFNNTEINEILRSASADDIDKVSFVICEKYELAAKTFQASQGFVYAPVIEPNHNTAFLTETQFELFKSGNYNRVPVIIGMASEESLILVNFGYSFNVFKEYDKNIEYLVPNDMHITDATNLSIVAKKIYEFSVGNNTFADNIAYGVKLHSMHDFDKGEIRQAELQSKFSSSIWFYDLTYDGKMGNNIVNRINPWVSGMGNVTHGEGLNYIFSRWFSNDIPDNTDPQYFSESDWKVHQRLMTLWTNFAKYQTPTPSKTELLQNVTWSGVAFYQFRYLNIGENLEMVSDFPKPELYKFWRQLFNEYAVPPLDTF